MSDEQKTEDGRCNGRTDEVCREIKRLRRIEKAATEAYEYHLTGYGAHTDFDGNTQLDLMNALGKALEELPRALNADGTHKTLRQLLDEAKALEGK